MSIKINAVDLEWKGRYGGGGGDAGGGGTGLSKSDVQRLIQTAIAGVDTGGLSKTEIQGMIDKSVGTLPKVTMEQVQQAITASGFVDLAKVQELIKAAGTGGSVDVPWKEIQIGYVSRQEILNYNSAITNNTTFRVPYKKAFSQPPIVIARADLGGMRFDAQITGGTEQYFQMQSNYSADVMGAHFIAFVPKG